MLTFDKISEVIEHVEDYGGFLILRVLLANEALEKYADHEIISQIIKSKFHHWRGEEEPDGIAVQISSSDKDNNVKTLTLTNHKFYGFFDNSKIKPEHYKVTSPDNFNDKLFQAINEETDFDNLFIERAKRIIFGRFNNSSTIYYLDLGTEKNSDMVAKWHVYDFFYAFIAINKSNNTVTLIEFGLD